MRATGALLLSVSLLRIEDLEVDRELHEVRLDDLEKKRSDSTQPGYFVARGDKFYCEGHSI